MLQIGRLSVQIPSAIVNALPPQAFITLLQRPLVVMGLVHIMGHQPF